MSRKGSRWFFGDGLHCCIVTMFSKGFGDHSSTRQVLLILRLGANVLVSGYCSKREKKCIYVCEDNRRMVAWQSSDAKISTSGKEE